MRHDPAGDWPYVAICNRTVDDQGFSAPAGWLCGSPSITHYLMVGQAFGRCGRHPLEEPMAPDVVRLSPDELAVWEVLAS